MNKTEKKGGSKSLERQADLGCDYQMKQCLALGVLTFIKQQLKMSFVGQQQKLRHSSLMKQARLMSKVFFLNPAFVDKSDAEGILAAMIRSVEKVGVPWQEFKQKLVGMGSDGASIMLGKNNGVAAKLRALQPSMYFMSMSFSERTLIDYCRANLKGSFRTLNKKVLLPTRIGGTRWVGHLLRALDNFLTGYEAVKQHLEQICSPDAVERSSASTSGKAKGLLKLVKSKQVMLYCFFLADIATILFRLSKVFQRRECCASDLYGMVEETKNLIDLYNFGDDKLNQLVAHFGPCLESTNTAEAVFKWTAMKAALYSSDLDIKSLTWQRVNEMYLDNYGNILAIMDLILTIPGSSPECERGFRQMKSVKATFRSSLNEESLASQMTIRLHSPTIEKFDPLPAIQLWNSGVTRKPNFKDVTHQEKIREATAAVTKEMTAEIGAVVQETEPELVTEPITKEPIHILLPLGSCEDSDYSDDEEYSSEAGVFRSSELCAEKDSLRNKLLELSCVFSLLLQ
ncbi:unnamed protein product [Mytilus coruscus]|uniref:HAT C-terminal dimerisation domain-containing protein n=1 Tax=Mytilus coruscus TaxID=42192 RepID=A0A6J8AW60_MYTCO|nr:unnamed protein product [Mytilus coruscus]